MCTGFTEEKSAPRIGWDGIIGQIVDSACDGKQMRFPYSSLSLHLLKIPFIFFFVGEQTHHILEDLLGEGGMAGGSTSNTKYYRLNPVVGAPNDFPIDGTDPELLGRLAKITSDYMEEPEQKQKLQEIRDTLDGRRGWRRLFPARP